MFSTQNDTESAADQRDVRLAREGEAEAYARLVRRHQAAIAQQMWRFTRDTEQHRELVHDVFVNAYISLHSYRGDGPFLHWLRKVAVRTGYAFWREARRRKHEEPLDSGLVLKLAHDPGGHEASEAAELVHSLLARLPPRDRLVLTLLYLEERNVEEIANLLGWTRTMVKVQLWRARGKLRRLLADVGSDRREKTS